MKIMFLNRNNKTQTTWKANVCVIFCHNLFDVFELLINYSCLLKGLHSYLTCGFRVVYAAKNRYISMYINAKAPNYIFPMFDIVPKMHEITKVYFWIFVESWTWFILNFIFYRSYLRKVLSFIKRQQISSFNFFLFMIVVHTYFQKTFWNILLFVFS